MTNLSTIRSSPRPHLSSALVVAVFGGTFCCVSTAHALRCAGTLIASGQRIESVQRACGQATTKHRYLGLNGADSVWIDEWTYNFGPRMLMRRIRFIRGKVHKIEPIGYGTGLRAKSTSRSRPGPSHSVPESTLDVVPIMIYGKRYDRYGYRYPGGLYHPAGRSRWHKKASAGKQFPVGHAPRLAQCRKTKRFEARPEKARKGEPQTPVNGRGAIRGNASATKQVSPKNARDTHQ